LHQRLGCKSPMSVLGKDLVARIAVASTLYTSKDTYNLVYQKACEWLDPEVRRRIDAANSGCSKGKHHDRMRAVFKDRTGADVVAGFRSGVLSIEDLRKLEYNLRCPQKTRR